MRSVKISDYMATGLVTFTPEMNVVEAMGLLLENKISGAPVVDHAGRLVGVLSEIDAMKVVIQDSYYDESAGVVADYMNAPVETVLNTMDIYQLAEKFVADHRRRYPVVDEAGILVGQISRRDVLRVAHKSLMHEEA